MDEKKKAELLAKIKETSARTHEMRRLLSDAAQERSDAVREALDFGVPRPEIAEAAGVSRTMIYRIAAGSDDNKDF